MKLGIRWLENYGGPNSWNYSGNPPSFVQGDSQTLYLQLVDEESSGTAGFARPLQVRRYVPAVGATLQATLDSVDDARKVVRFLTQPSALDPSIWRLDVTTADPVVGTVDLRLVLTEGAVVHRAIAKGALRVQTTARV